MQQIIYTHLQTYFFTYFINQTKTLELYNATMICKYQCQNRFGSSLCGSSSPALLQVYQLHAFTVGPRPWHPHLVSQENKTWSRNETRYTSLPVSLKHSQTLTVGVLWEASCCRRGKGVHWIGSTGQLQTERSLALPESNTPSPILISLPLHAYWELQWIQKAKVAVSRYYTGIGLVCVNKCKHTRIVVKKSY